MQPEFDYVVVGAGTAGCLLANRLSRSGQHRVLLLEAGGDDRYLWVHVPIGYLRCIGNPRTDWMFSTEPVSGLNGRRLRYPRGKLLGGCSSINGMIYMRGQSRDYEHWAQLTGEPAWAWDQVLPLFRQHEDHWRGSGPWHGSGGEWRVEPQRLRWELLDAFAQAAQEAGLPASSDFNTGNNEGVGYFEVNQRRGIRWNAAKAFLRPALGRPNLEVWTHSQVASLQLHRQPDHSLRCTGVRLLSGGGRPQAVTARRAVVLAAGAVGSAQLLQLSGIGSAQLLQQLGIQPELDLPGVGANLQDHLQIRAVFAVQGSRTLNTLSRSWWARLGMGLRYVLTQSGPLSMAPSQLGAFARSSPDQPWPNVQYHVQPLSLPAFGEPLDEQDAFTASVCHLNPSSRGTVRLASADPRQAPLIQPNYLSTSEDRAVAAQALRLTRRIAAQPALARFAPREVKPGMQFETDEDLARLAGEIGTTIFHPVGTCRMGREDDPLAVVGPRLKVRGVEGLHVADASVMPTITSGNTNAPTLMIAEQAARWLSSAA